MVSATSLLAFVLLAAAPAATFDESEQAPRRTPLTIPETSEPTREAPVRADDDAAGATSACGADALVGLSMLLVGAIGAIAPPFCGALAGAYALGPTAASLLFAGPVGALVAVLTVSALAYALTGRSPLLSWAGASPGLLLLFLSGAVLATRELSANILLSDEDRASASSCSPTSAALVHAGVIMLALGALTCVSGPLMVFGATVGIAAAEPPSDWPPPELHLVTHEKALAMPF